MKVLVDINHPAHFHVLKNVMRLLEDDGHDVLVVVRDKEMALALVQGAGLSHVVLSEAGSGSIWGFIKELAAKDLKLLKYVLANKPDIMVAVAGTFISHVSALTRIPSLAIYDTEDARLQNAITYPFLTRLLVPNCYSGWAPKRKTSRFSGYHELAYLHPRYFKACRETAELNGVDFGKRNIFLRLVAWNANHDIGYFGWTDESLTTLIAGVGDGVNILISSERKLPSKYDDYMYKGDIASVHHVLAYCDLFIGESATMAAECAVLGVPSLYLSNAYRSYMVDIQNKYGLVKIVENFDFDVIFSEIARFLAIPQEVYQAKCNQLISDSVDVSSFLKSEILSLV